MRLLIGVTLGCLGVLCIVAGVEGRALQLFSTITGKGVDGWTGGSGGGGSFGTAATAPAPAPAGSSSGTGSGYVLTGPVRNV